MSPPRKIYFWSCLFILCRAFIADTFLVPSLLLLVRALTLLGFWFVGLNSFFLREYQNDGRELMFIFALLPALLLGFRAGIVELLIKINSVIFVHSVN